VPSSRTGVSPNLHHHGVFAHGRPESTSSGHRGSGRRASQLGGFLPVVFGAHAPAGASESVRHHTSCSAPYNIAGSSGQPNSSGRLAKSTSRPVRILWRRAHSCLMSRVGVSCSRLVISRSDRRRPWKRDFHPALSADRALSGKHTIRLWAPEPQHEPPLCDAVAAPTRDSARINSHRSKLTGLRPFERQESRMSLKSRFHRR
jgi:hypothetical protein